MEKKNGPQADLPRTFMTAAYLVEVEPGTFGLYRNIEVEVVEGGVTRREKAGKPVGPIGLFRRCEAGERPDMRSSDREGNPLELRKIS